MSDEKALLAAIWEYPHEDTPRLVYADWLQEQGGEANVARAEFIRVQCEMAHVDWYSERWKELKSRATKLSEPFTGEWKRGCSAAIRNASYERGFFRPQSRTYTASQFLALKLGALDEAPAWEIELKSYNTNFHKVAASANLARVGWLSLKPRSLGRCLDLLAESPHARHVKRLVAWLDDRDQWKPTATDAPGLASLTELRLFGKMTGSRLMALAESVFAPTISSLDLEESEGIGPAGLTALARGDRFTRLKQLDLTLCKLGAADFRSITPAAVAPNITSLDLGYNQLGDTGLAALLASPLVAQVTVLKLNVTSLTDAGIAALAEWPGAARLTDLHLRGNAIGRAGVEALTRSSRLTALRNLNLRGNPLNDDRHAVEILKERFATQVRELSFTLTPTTEAVTQSASWCGLYSI